jgi:hypothetical protein
VYLKEKKLLFISRPSIERAKLEKKRKGKETFQHFALSDKHNFLVPIHTLKKEKSNRPHALYMSYHIFFP